MNPEPEDNDNRSESSSESHENNDTPQHNYPNAKSNRIINQLFQDILNRQEETLLTNFNILMQDQDGILDIQTRDDMMQDQLRELVAALTGEFVEIFSERSEVASDEFCKCAICFGDEVPYIRLNCACKIMLHKECYIEYLERSQTLSCPICKESIFQNYLKND